MANREVGKDSFWKERLEKAEERNFIYKAVYNVPPEVWKHIEMTHQGIIGQYMIGEKVLDAGCGYGRLSELFKEDSYVGIDLSPTLIDKARKLYPKHTFTVQSLRKTNFKDKEFDWAICVSIKGMVVRELGWKAWGEMEEELRRVAKNILILEYTNPDKYEVIYN